MAPAEQLERLAEELGLALEDDTERDVRDYLEDLSGYLERWDDSLREASPRGIRATDEYNALLDVYEAPRQRVSNGLLGDMTLVIKDNIAVEGLRMTCGSKRVGTVPTHDATVVDRLLDAGAQIVGKANMDAFAFGPGGLWSEQGQVRNPLSGERIPGGTSSGSGVAVAAGLVDAALGSDTGGSIRSPAACCGVVGIKPTHGRVSRYGLVGNVPSADTIGPLARDVETAARILEVIQGPDPRDPTVSPVESPPLHRKLDDFEALRVGVLDLEPHEISEPVTGSISELVSELDAHTSVSIESFDLELETVGEAYTIISGAEFAWLLRQSFGHRGGVTAHPNVLDIIDSRSFNDHIAERVLPGAYLDTVTKGHAYALAQRQVVTFKRELDAHFERFDVLLTPTLRTLPPKPEQLRSTEGGFKYTLAKQFSLAGLPAVSVPFAERNGLPVSAQVLAPRFEDRTAILAAHLIEQLSTRG